MTLSIPVKMNGQYLSPSLIDPQAGRHLDSISYSLSLTCRLFGQARFIAATLEPEPRCNIRVTSRARSDSLTQRTKFRKIDLLFPKLCSVLICHSFTEYFRCSVGLLRRLTSEIIHTRASSRMQQLRPNISNSHWLAEGKRLEVISAVFSWYREVQICCT